MKKNYSNWIDKVLNVAKIAVAQVLEIYQKKNYQIQSKKDNTPVTEADVLANIIIQRGLKDIDPSIPIISEEDLPVPYSLRSTWKRFWLIDPLDGTREFIQGTGDFSVNIALIENNMPVLGVVAVPVQNQYYWAIGGGKAYFQDDDKAPQVLQTPSTFSFPIRMAVSRYYDKQQYHVFELLKDQGEIEFVYYGSALKICLVARGDVDFYPRLGPTGEWDTAAGQCILEAAGGKLVDLQGRSLRYNTHVSFINPGFFASGCVDLLSYIVDKSGQIFES